MLSCRWQVGAKTTGLVGDTPYASKEYAKAALKNLSECKGGDADESTGQKRMGRKKVSREAASNFCR